MLDAAARLLESGGPAALTVRAIAALAGVSPMSIYNRFENKDGVVGALFRLGFDQLSKQFRSVDKFDPSQRLIETGRRYRQFALAHRALYAVMFERAIPGFEPDESSKEHAVATFGLLMTLVSQLIDQGVLAPADPSTSPSRFGRQATERCRWSYATWLRRRP